MRPLISRSKGLIGTLLKKNISAGQLVGYFIANIIGFAIIMTGIMFFSDSRHSENSDAFIPDDYLILSKQVDGIGFAPIYFDNNEIAHLKQQPWIKKLGCFTPAQFTIKGSLELGSKFLASYLFIESVPDEFFDIKPQGWDYQPGDKFIPIVISKDYLTLYNFGFAIPQGLPQVSEELVSSIPIDIDIYANDLSSDRYEGRIVGFSSRLNTIAVPQSFMQWANERYTSDKTGNRPSRLIVEIDRLNAQGMDDYLLQRGIMVSGENNDVGNIAKFLSLTSAIVTINGVLICALATFILILSIFLLLQKSKEMLQKLFSLGYSPQEVGGYYERIVLAINFTITIFSIIVALVARSVWLPYMEEIGIGGASQMHIYITAALYFVLTTAINITVIRHRLNDIWQNR